MTPFLQQAARFFYAQGPVERTCFIFPNRRARSFFKKYLAEEIGKHAQAPVTAPAMLTMNEFFYAAGKAVPTDRVHLLLNLYDCYSRLNPKAESRDDFIFWGDVLLSDFDDVDKYLVNPSHLFANVADFKNIQDSYSYLSEGQQEAIERFLGHFRNVSATAMGTSGTKKDYKAEFLRIWDILLRLYEDFRALLKEKGMCYEGQVYRDFADRLTDESVVDILGDRFPDSDNFVFIGLNALNECEKKVMRKMRDAGIASFCWDYSSEAIKDPHNKSSVFLKDNVADFPQAFMPDPDGLPVPEFNVISVPSSIGQAKQLPEILKMAGGNPGIDTAIVLPDEKLLIPVLNSIPAEIAELNVTMGYPMNGSELWNLMGDISALQLHMRLKDGKWYFYHKQVWAIFSNSLVKTAADGEDAAIMDSVRSGAKYYIPEEDLCGSALLKRLFKPVVTDPAATSAGLNAGIGRYLQEILLALAPRLKGNPDMNFELDFAKEYYQAISRLIACDIEVLPATWFRLLSQVMGGCSVPFVGEPLKGLQIMGPLETRALDFDNVVILSCNEGMFPRKSVSSSFIPPELRKGFGLPTYEYQDSVWAYYFYRLIQRAKKVWMLFDSRAEGLRGGEQSRYIKQLELHFGVKVRHYVVKAPISHETETGCIEKTAQDLEVLRTRNLSASALQNYLTCPAKFYYHSVCGLKEDEEVSESLDSGMLGDVFHKTMQQLYAGHREISAGYLKKLLSDPAGIKATVDTKIREALHSFEVTGRNIIFEDVVCSYVDKVLRRDLELLGKYGTDRFTVHGLELKVGDVIDGFSFIGFIDRLDSFSPGEIRVVDYKTGKVTDNDFIINEDNAESVVNALFGKDNAKRPKIALQLYLYDRFIKRKKGLVDGKTILNSIYQTSRLFVGGVENVALNDSFCSLMDEKLSGLLKEISDLERPWERLGDEKACGWCEFKTICGK